MKAVLSTLIAFSLHASAAVTVRTEQIGRQRAEWNAPAWDFKTIPKPSKSAASRSASIAIVGRAAPSCLAPGALGNGVMPRQTRLRRDFFTFANGTDGGLIVMDLDKVIPVAEINSYSAHGPVPLAGVAGETDPGHARARPRAKAGNHEPRMVQYVVCRTRCSHAGVGDQGRRFHSGGRAAQGSDRRLQDAFRHRLHPSRAGNRQHLPDEHDRRRAEVDRRIAPGAARGALCLDDSLLGGVADSLGWPGSRAPRPDHAGDAGGQPGGSRPAGHGSHGNPGTGGLGGGAGFAPAALPPGGDSAFARRQDDRCAEPFLDFAHAASP